VAFAHEALLDLERGSDPAAPGAAVTVELCGHWTHEPPCPLAPHHSRAVPGEDGVRLRVLFAVDPAVEAEVRDRIDRALARGTLEGPTGVTRWRVLASAPAVVAPHEREHAARLTGGATP
jgi:hypothetical protein